MLGFSKKNKESRILAPMSGTVIPLSEVPDEAFSEKMLGDGVAIFPDSGDVFSPVDGTIEDITDTLHAFCIRDDNGTDILLHIGINTVNLKGEGFEVFVSAGDRVTAGQPIARVDLDSLKKHGLPFHTPVLLTEPEGYEIKRVESDFVKGGEDQLFTYKKK